MTAKPRLPGTNARIGPYVTEAMIGRGGMGAVFRARHEQTGVRHAVKVVLPDARRGEESRAERIAARFAREREAMARIDAHPGIVRIHASGEHDGIPWYSMELVDGHSLAFRLRGHPLADRPEGVRIVAEVADAIAHAHRHGIVHRDLKPENILLAADGRVRVTDFGVAADAHAEALTATGEVLGTPGYMPPEQVSGQGGPARSAPAVDVYGLGGILYAVLTGRPPFAREGTLRTMMAVLKEPLVRPRAIDPSIPAALDAICVRALERDPARRYASAAAFATDLRRWERGEPVSAEARRGISDRLRARVAGRSRWLLAGAGLLAAIAVGVGIAVRAGSAKPESPKAALARVEEALVAGTRAAPEDVAALRAIAASPTVPAIARRAEVLALLAEQPAELASALADRLRRDAPDDAGLARTVQLALLARDDRATLHALLVHPAAPVRAVMEVAPALARHLIARDLPPPLDLGAFASIYEAPGLDDAERGALLLLRSRLLRERGELDGALDALTAAWRRHGVVDAGPWRPAFRAHCLEAMPERALRDVACAWAVDAALTRMDGGDPAHPHPEVAGRLIATNQEILDGGVRQTLTPELRRGIAGRAYLTWWGLDPPRPLYGDHLLLGEDFLRGVTRMAQEAEGAAPGERNEALLLAIAGGLAGKPGLALEDGRPARWYETVIARLPDDALARSAPFQLLLARVALVVGRPAEAVAHAGAAREAEAAAPPPGLAWPEIPLVAATARLAAAGETGGDLDAVAALLAEAIERQRARDEAGFVPFPLVGDVRVGLVDVCAELVRRMTEADGARCCATERAIGPGALLDRAGTVAARREQETTSIELSLLLGRGDHALAHGELEEAVRIYSSGLLRWQITPPPASRNSIKEALYRGRARARRALGDDAAARDDERKADELRVPGGGG